jgi:hypothetical protein
MNTLATPNSKFTLTPTGIEFHEELNFDEWKLLGIELGKADNAVAFMIGDWINYGEGRYGERINEAIKLTGLTRQTIWEYAYVTRRIQPFARAKDLDYSIHRTVAKLKTPEEQKHWLDIAEEHDLSVRRLRKSINFGRLATEEEVQGDPADRGYVTYLALLNRIRRWWARETQKAPVDEWDEDRRQGLKKDFKLILDIYESL